VRRVLSPAVPGGHEEPVWLLPGPRNRRELPDRSRREGWDRRQGRVCGQLTARSRTGSRRGSGAWSPRRRCTPSASTPPGLLNAARTTWAPSRATSPACSARCAPCPGRTSRLRDHQPARPPGQASSPNGSAATGRSRTSSTGSATSPSARTPPPAEPAPDRTSWRRSYLVISILRLAGPARIARALRHAARDPARAFRLFTVRK
jgi:hypothetical protein